MGSPSIHAELSAKRFGGKAEDYIEIHDLIDSSKTAFSDLRHRALTHNSWFVTTILERIFGRTIKNSSGIRVAVRDIGQWHIVEDFKGSFPTVQDYLENLPFAPWMNNGEDGAVPPSHAKLPAFDKKLLVPKNEKNPESESEQVTPKERVKNILQMGNAPDTSPRSGCGGGGRFD